MKIDKKQRKVIAATENILDVIEKRKEAEKKGEKKEEKVDLVKLAHELAERKSKVASN